MGTGTQKEDPDDMASLHAQISFWIEEGEALTGLCFKKKLFQVTI